MNISEKNLARANARIQRSIVLCFGLIIYRALKGASTLIAAYFARNIT